MPKSCNTLPLRTKTGLPESPTATTVSTEFPRLGPPMEPFPVGPSKSYRKKRLVLPLLSTVGCNASNEFAPTRFTVELAPTAGPVSPFPDWP